MRRSLATGAIGISLLAPAGAAASHGDSGTGQRDFAVGAGNNEFALGAIGEARFSLSASSDPFGLDPRGYVTSSGDPDGVGPLEPFTARGEVTCLDVEGNRATIKWRIEEGTGSAEPFEGGGVESWVEDNGPPRAGEPADRAAVSPPQPALLFDPTADVCEQPEAQPLYDRLDQGNVVVHDATGA